MRLARVVGNVVSTIKERTHVGKKLLIVEYLDETGAGTGQQQIALDAVDAGIGDRVLINAEGGSAKMLLNDKDVISNCVIAGVIDHFTFGEVVVDN
ncbi:MAG: EutN/CcmL family microcompartment protein [Clostridiales bacterium]|nr:EutN/CcmL family microcompartment protein [Clostridiales bacterium]